MAVCKLQSKPLTPLFHGRLLTSGQGYFKRKVAADVDTRTVNTWVPPLLSLPPTAALFPQAATFHTHHQPWHLSAD